MNHENENENENEILNIFMALNKTLRLFYI
jgi:hypothetical protein